MSELKRTWAEINLDNLAHNYKVIREKTNTKFLAVVKADAYGHGAVQISKCFEELGVDYLAVSSLDEATELRLGGITAPILILGHTPPEQTEKLISLGITQAVSCYAKALEYQEMAKKTGKVLKIHIKVDTGMSRLGFLCSGEHFDEAIANIISSVKLKNLFAEGIFTHFAVSDEDSEKDREYTKEQFLLFMKVIDRIKENGYEFAIRHCANSGAVAGFPEAYLDMVRPGILVYGYGALAQKMGLKPVMSVKAAISTIKIFDSDTFVSYGRTYKTKDKTRIGVLPIGYADGFFRILSDNYEVETYCGKAPVCGRICMDMCMVDISSYPSLSVGSEVEIFGEHNPIEIMAEKAHTVPYEIVCAVSKRVPRLYFRGEKLVERELRLKI